MYALSEIINMDAYKDAVAHWKRATSWKQQWTDKHPGVIFQHVRLDEWLVYVPTPGYAVPVVISDSTSTRTNPLWKWAEAYTLLGLVYGTHVPEPMQKDFV